MMKQNEKPAEEIFLDNENGLLKKVSIPNKDFGEQWDKIFISKEIKDRLLCQALLSFTFRGSLSQTSVPIHGIILLIGPPGTGKTTLARGLANSLAQSLNDRAWSFIEVEPHGLASSSLGKSQKAVTKLLQRVLAEHAEQGPLVVLLDEVEVLAGNRQRMSLEANPIDVHRASDAVLAGVDFLAKEFPNILFIATSNFVDAIDEAFISRADLTQVIDVPDKETCRAIIEDTLDEISTKWPEVKKRLEEADLNVIAHQAEGLDGRSLRKAVVSAFSFSKEVALNPNKVAMSDLEKAIQYAKERQRK